MLNRIFWSIKLLCIFLFWSPLLSGQSFFVNAGAESFSMGTCNTANSTDWSSVNNISGITSIEKPTIATSYKKYYDDININNTYLTAIYPLKNFTLAAVLSRHGNEFFNIQRHAIGIANTIGFTDLGVQVNYIQYSAEGFGSKSTVAFDFGGTVHFSERLHFGAHIFNFTQSTLGSPSREPIPIITKVGINYIPVDHFAISADIEKEINSEPLFKFGLSYKILDQFYARTGALLNPLKNYFGVGYHRDKFNFDYGFEYYSYLGMTHQLSFSIRLNTL